jgi:hypothetical protein
MGIELTEKNLEYLEFISTVEKEICCLLTLCPFLISLIIILVVLRNTFYNIWCKDNIRMA